MFLNFATHLVFDNVSVILNYVIPLILLLALGALFCFFGRNISLPGTIVLFSLLIVGFGVSSFFSLTILSIVLLATFFLAGFVVVLMNLTKTSINSLFDFKPRKASKRKISKVFSKENLYDEITEAVISLSKKKIGAIITFEKNDPLDEYLVNGVAIDAPVSHQLLGTIFYPGTPLHDGAIIIRKNIILAASVYYSLSTKPMRGKLGSRHRAAIGISEVCDAITIIVSEETGRVSITQNGELEEVHVDQLYRTLEDYLG